MRGGAAWVALVVLSSGLAACLGAPADAPGPEAPIDVEAPAPGPAMPHVVVAQFDTGTNPFHPCFRRPGWDASAAGIPGFPPDARPLSLEFRDSYEASLEASEAAIEAIEEGVLYHVLDTNLLFYGRSDHLVDTWPHGAQASSQVVCQEYGMAPNAWLVVLNWYRAPSAVPAMLTWVAQQPWIDVVHLNIQDVPVPMADARTEGIRGLIEAGQMVVIAGGNGVNGGGVNYPMELSRYNGPPGSLIAGANDNGGYTTFSNMNPHVVMDGCGTVAAEPYGFGDRSFGGTSSASPRITGYATALLQAVRNATDARDGRDGQALVRLPADVARPERGPMADGVLTVAQLHEAIRKTALPNPHDSKYNGQACVGIPQPVDTPYAVYVKMGYGQVSEHTFPVALAALLGAVDLPPRAVEDGFFEVSETLRQQYWG